MSLKIGPISIGGKGGIAFQPGKMNLMDLAQTAALFAPGGNLGALGSNSAGLRNVLPNLGVNGLLGDIKSGNIAGLAGNPLVSGLLGGIGGKSALNNPNSYGDPALDTLIGLLGSQAIDENTRNSILNIINNRYRDLAIQALDPANMPEQRFAYEQRTLNRNLNDANQQASTLRSQGYGGAITDGIMLGAHNRAMEDVADWDANSRATEQDRVNQIMALTNPSYNNIGQLTGVLGTNENLKSSRMANYTNAPLSPAEALQQIMAHLGLIGNQQQKQQPAVNSAPAVKVQRPWTSVAGGMVKGIGLPGVVQPLSNKSAGAALALSTPGAQTRNTRLSMGSFGTGLSGAGLAAGMGTL